MTYRDMLRQYIVIMSRVTLNHHISLSLSLLRRLHKYLDNAVQCPEEQEINKCW